MQRFPLLLVVPVTCVLACSDTTQPVDQYPPPSAVLRLSTAGVLGGPVRDTVCFARQDPGQNPNYVVDPHFSTPLPVTTFADPIGADTVCGNLSFNGRMRGFTATYTTNPSITDENPWKYWWMRSRRADDGSGVLYEIDRDSVPGDSLASVSFDSIWLSSDYDAIGVILVLNASDTLAISDLPFTDFDFNGHGDLNILFQHWAHKEPPEFTSLARNGSEFTLIWTNEHAGRSIDSTSIYRNDGTGDSLIAIVGPSTSIYRNDGTGDSLIAIVGPLDTMCLDTVPGPGVYAYTLKHISLPTVVSQGATGGWPAFPNSPASNAMTDTVPLPIPPSVEVDGPSYITKPKDYSWALDVSGTSPFTYAWWVKPFGPGTEWQLVATTSTYVRYVGYSDMGFQIRADVTDPYQQLGADTLAVSTAWGYGPQREGHQ